MTLAPDGEVCWLSSSPVSAMSVARLTPRRRMHAVEARCVIGSANDPVAVAVFCD